MINKYNILNRAKSFSGIFQNYLVFIPAKKYIKYFHGTTQIYSWKSNRISEKTKSDSNFTPTFADHHVLPDMNFNGHCLINNNISISKKVIKIHISSIRYQWPRDLITDFISGNFIFESVELTENSDPDKNKYSGYGIGFDSSSEFSFTDRSNS